jgi:hypothetical protein
LNKEITGNRDFLDEILISAREEAEKYFPRLKKRPDYAERRLLSRRKLSLKRERSSSKR